jgi:hypothetical protein
VIDVTFDQILILDFSSIGNDVKELGVIQYIDSAPRGFEEINDENFEKILKATKTDENFIID